MHIFYPVVTKEYLTSPCNGVESHYNANSVSVDLKKKKDTLMELNNGKSSG